MVSQECTPHPRLGVLNTSRRHFRPCAPPTPAPSGSFLNNPTETTDQTPAHGTLRAACAGPSCLDVWRRSHAQPH